MNIVSATITGSLILNGVNISSITGSESSIAALNSFTASAATTGSNQFIGNQTVTGSVNITGSLIVTGSIIGTVTTASYVLNAVSASYAANATTSSFALNATSASYALVATSASYSLNATTSSYALIATSASYAANADLLDGRDSLTFANTGSNAFVGTQNINGAVAITGSLTTTGTITAQTLNVQQVTSSIVYSSGSNIFGNSVSNTQSMTGSVGISGSLSVNGVLTGTSATFTGNSGTSSTRLTLQGTGDGWNNQLITNTSGSLWLGVMRDDGIAPFTSGSAFASFLGSSNATSLILTTNATPRLTISSTGAATFSGLITSTIGVNNYLKASNASTDGLFIENQNNGSVVRLTITSGGNVGIGTTSPSALLNTFSASTATQIIVTGADTTNQRLEVTDGTVTNRFGIFGRTNGDAGVLGTQTNHALVFNTNATERMRITSTGNMYVGANIDSASTSTFLSGLNGFGAKVSNNAYFLFTGLNSSDVRTFYVLGTGDVKNTNNSYGAISDFKLKENIKDATPKLDDLLKVKIRNYNLIGDDKKQIGVIAQELEEIFPAMVDELEDFEELEVPQIDEEGNEVLNEEGKVVTTKQRVSKGTATKSVKYSVFVPMLIKAIQELKAEIDLLKG